MHRGIVKLQHVLMRKIPDIYRDFYYVILSCDGLFRLAGGLTSPLSTCKIGTRTTEIIEVQQRYKDCFSANRELSKRVHTINIPFLYYESLQDLVGHSLGG